MLFEILVIMRCYYLLWSFLALTLECDTLLDLGNDSHNLRHFMALLFFLWHYLSSLITSIHVALLLSFLSMLLLLFVSYCQKGPWWAGRIYLFEKRIAPTISCLIFSFWLCFILISCYFFES